MADWVITATTIYCDAIDDEVTILVNRDGTSKCTGYTKYSRTDKEKTKSIEAKNKQLGKHLRCDGPECHRVTQYRDKLFTEEAKQRESISNE